MKIVDIVKEMMKIYGNSEKDNENYWNQIKKDFYDELTQCSDPKILLSALRLDFYEWLIPFEERLSLMEKIKNFGVEDIDFLKDYYGYKAAFLDPTTEQKHAKAELDRLIED